VSQGFLRRQCMHTLSFVRLSLPDVVSGSSPPSPLHSDPQSFNPWGRLGCIEPSAHLEGCVKLSLFGSASAWSARAAKLAKSADVGKGPRSGLADTFAVMRAVCGPKQATIANNAALHLCLAAFPNVDACKPHADLAFPSGARSSRLFPRI